MIYWWNNKLVTYADEIIGILNNAIALRQSQ
jgi:hypothetical protein